ncbi:MAG TPA: response regulator transcription factor [Verrucomicrobiae bacterium]
MPNVSLNAATPMSAAEKPEIIRVAIVEDNDGLLLNLRRLLIESPGFDCVGTHRSAESALKTLAKEKPDVVLMDINLPDINGVECVRQLKLAMPATVFVMHTVYENAERIFQAVQAGASGYLLKRTDPAALLQAIREAANGGAPMTSVIARKVLDAFRPQIPAPATTAPPPGTVGLSVREQAVLEKLAKGFLVKEIADQLGVSYATIRTYTERIYEKLHVRSRSEAAARYYQSQR